MAVGQCDPPSLKNRFNDGINLLLLVVLLVLSFLLHVFPHSKEKLQLKSLIQGIGRGVGAWGGRFL